MQFKNGPRQKTEKKQTNKWKFNRSVFVICVCLECGYIVAVEVGLFYLINQCNIRESNLLPKYLIADADEAAAQSLSQV